MKLKYNAKCTICGKQREVSSFKRQIRKFNPSKAAITYVKCYKCEKKTKHEVIK